MNILVSACLLGIPCRYDGKEIRNENVLALAGEHNLIPICPECIGGLPTPRSPSERVEDRVLSKEGRDVTAEFLRGAEAALTVSRLCHCHHAILKENSPSCGKGRIYDGSFSNKLTDGNGVTAELLMKNGIHVTGESDIEKILLG